MENKQAFTLGLLTLILVSTGIFLKWYVINRIQDILVFVFFLVAINASILVMLGGIYNSKSLAGTGFGLGIGSFTVILVLITLSIPAISSSIMEWDGNVLYGAFCYGGTFGSHPYDYMELFLTLIAIDTRISHEIMVIWDIIQICIISPCIPLSSLSFGLVMRNK